MLSDNKHFNSLVQLLLPSEIFEYFEIIDIEVNDKDVNVYLDELYLKPEEFKNEKLISKGFHSVAIIQDFPLRDRAMFLHVRRRRWLVESSGDVISRDWDAVAKGTRYTQGFATFLKDIFGQLSD
jgi:hypothetical protein